MDQPSHFVAVVDDDPGVCKALCRLVRAFGHEARAFGSGNALLYGIGPRPPSDVLLDLHMPGIGGPPLIARIRARWPDVRILVMSGLETPGAADACLAAGATCFFRKPIQPWDIENFLTREGDGAA
jgi:FixJ family two-component response regulator